MLASDHWDACTFRAASTLTEIFRNQDLPASMKEHETQGPMLHTTDTPIYQALK